MKKIKRMIAVLLLIVTVLAVGYLVYTGSRTASVRESGSEAVYVQTF